MIWSVKTHTQNLQHPQGKNPKTTRRHSLPFPIRSAYPVCQWTGSIFSRKALEKISTLKPLTYWIFAVALRSRQRGTGKNALFPIAARFILRQNRLHYFAAYYRLGGATRPEPPTSSKEQNFCVEFRYRVWYDYW